MNPEAHVPWWRKLLSARSILIALVVIIAIAPYSVIAIQGSTIAKLTHQIIALGHTPVVSKPIQSVTGDKGPAGKSGDQGPKGDPGENVTDSQAYGAVSAYCFVHNNCQGPTGIPGINGTNGNDGQNATPEQIASAVSAYCAANNNCQGPQGQPGTNGADGSQGPAGSGPTSYSFTVLGIQYTCTDPDGDGNYTCTPS